MDAKLLTADRFVDTDIGCSYRLVKSETEYFRLHYHDYYEIFFCVSGKATHYINGETQRLYPGTLGFIRPFDRHDYAAAGSAFTMYNLTFTRQTLREILNFLGTGFPAERLLSAALPPTVALTGQACREVQNRIERLYTLPTGARAELKWHLRALLLYLLCEYFSDYRPPAKTKIPAWLESMAEAMREPRCFTAGAAKMIELSGRSREHISRCLKKYYGLSVSDFINGLRLEYMANLLLNSNQSVIDICFACGFQNLSWAYSLFKKQYGVTPAAYRRAPVPLRERPAKLD